MKIRFPLPEHSKHRGFCLVTSHTNVLLFFDY